VNYNPTEGLVVEEPAARSSLLRSIALAAASLVLGLGIGMFMQRERSQREFVQTLDAPNQVDVGFLQDMMTHHEQAIQMSVIAMSRGSDPAVRQEALDILLAQRGEYVQMADKLESWGVDVESADGTVMGWMGMPMAPEQMPGLASVEEMANLKTLKGTEADIEFLRLMIDHHAGGVEMAKAASSGANVAFVKVLADGMAALQAVEIAEMQAFARRLGANLAPPDTSHAQHSGAVTTDPHAGHK
jgi:uncharacterized protein (DUF305 family)